MPRSWLDLTGFQYYIHLSFTLSESPGIDSRNHLEFKSGRCRETGLILCITERGLSKEKMPNWTSIARSTIFQSRHSFCHIINWTGSSLVRLRRRWWYRRYERWYYCKTCWAACSGWRSRCINPPCWTIYRKYYPRWNIRFLAGRWDELVVILAGR